MKFAAVGDALIIRRIPETYPGFEGARDWISQADAKYFNLETTLHREGECFGFAANGGSYLRSEPEVLEDCKRYGFNMTSDDTMHELFRKRSNNFTRGLQTDRKMFETVVPRWEMDENGKLTKLEFLAVELGFGLPRSRNGMPAPAKDDSILKRLAEMSEPYGVKLQINGNVANVILEEMV